MDWGAGRGVLAAPDPGPGVRGFRPQGECLLESSKPNLGAKAAGHCSHELQATPATWGRGGDCVKMCVHLSRTSSCGVG